MTRNPSTVKHIENKSEGNSYSLSEKTSPLYFSTSIKVTVCVSICNVGEEYCQELVDVQREDKRDRGQFLPFVVVDSLLYLFFFTHLFVLSL